MSHNRKFNWRYYNVPFEKATNCQKFVSLKFAIISPNCHSFGEIFMNFTIVFYYVYNPSEICSAFPNFLTILHQIAQLNLHHVKHFWQMFAKFSLTFLVEVFVRSSPCREMTKNQKGEFPDFFLFAIFESIFLCKITLEDEKVYLCIVFWMQLAFQFWAAGHRFVCISR